MRLIRVVWLLVLGTLIGCGPKYDVAEWTEELLLHDGKSITVWRRAVAKSGGFPEPRGANLEFELKYEPMGVHWKGSPEHHLLAFDVIEGTAWLLTSANRETCQKREKTDFRVDFYKWQSGKWEQVPIQDFPIHVARYNLWSSYWGREAESDARGLITWKRKSGSFKTPPQSVYDYLTQYNFRCAVFQ